MSLRAGDVVSAGMGYATVLADMDFETYSEAGYYFCDTTQKWKPLVKGKPGIKGVGAAVYAAHPSTEIISLAYDLKDGFGPRLWVAGMPPPVELFNYLSNGGIVEAHNSMFEYLIWNYVGHLKLGWPVIKVESLRCSKSKARAWSLPGQLKDLCKVLGKHTVQKDKAGESLIPRLCCPKQPTKKNATLRRTPTSDPVAFGQLYQYNIVDIESEASASIQCPDLSPYELAVWQMDQRINIRGVSVDVESMQSCISIIDQAAEKYTLELQELTNGEVKSVAEVANLRAWCEQHGEYLPDLRAETVTEALKDPFINEKVKRALEIRALLASNSVKKPYSLRAHLCHDNKVRGLFEYAGADRTSRWAGRGPQPQNFPSGGPPLAKCTACGEVQPHKGLCRACGSEVRKTDWCAEGVELALKSINTRDLAQVEAEWGAAIPAVMGVLRGLFVASPGYEFVCSDFTAIEGVVLAALAREEWRLEVFRTHGLIYEASAAEVTDVTLEQMIAYKRETGSHHKHRKLGKVAELASGYGGGLGAWKNFGADEFMSDEEIKMNVKKWRQASPNIEKFWYGVQEAAHNAVLFPGTEFPYNDVTYITRGDVLYCRLPSGRYLNYHTPRVEYKTNKYGKEQATLTYWGWNTDSSKGAVGWVKLETWGGKLTENIVQAVARDLMAHAQLQVPYHIALHVHDEIVVEAPVGAFTVEELEAIMQNTPDWAAGWPIKADGGWVGHRYRK